MKIKSIILSVIAIFSLCECSKDKSEEPYSNQDIVEVNAKAALYFHTVFREVENAWAFIDSAKYKSGTYPDHSNPSPAVKNLTYVSTDTGTGTLTIEYNAWKSGEFLLIGTISVKFAVNSYQRDNNQASVFLTDFSIDAHSIVGEPTIQYKKVSNNDNDHYTYKLTDGAVYEKNRSMSIMISGAITNGQYVRTEGDSTILLQDDDVWAYSGTMTGILFNDPNLKYTNTIQTNNVIINEVGYESPVVFTMDCNTAKQGASNIVITGRPDILYGYKCSDHDFISVTKIE